MIRIMIMSMRPTFRRVLIRLTTRGQDPTVARAMEFAFRKGKPPDCFQS